MSGSNTDDSDITMQGSEHGGTNNKPALTQTKLLRISKLILTLSSMISSNNFQKKTKNFSKE